LASAVRSQNHIRNLLRSNSPQLRDSDLKFRQNFQKKSFKGFVRTIDFVNQQYRRRRFAKDRPQKGTSEKKIVSENMTLQLFGWLVTFLPDFNCQKLLLVVPLVQRRMSIQSLIALEADQLGSKKRRENFCNFRFADACVPLDQERLWESHEQINCRS